MRREVQQEISGVRQEMSGLRQEMKAGFERVEDRFERFEDRFERMQRTMLNGVIALTSGFLAGFAALIVLIAALH